jgi:hypothetical protein
LPKVYAGSVRFATIVADHARSSFSSATVRLGLRSCFMAFPSAKNLGQTLQQSFYLMFHRFPAFILADAY